MQEEFEQFEGIYSEYLDRLKELDLQQKAQILGCDQNGGELIVPFYGKQYRVSASGVFDMQGNRPLHAVIVVLCQYLLLSPDKPVQDKGDWVSFKDFQDAAPFAGAFVTNVENKIVKNFEGWLQSLYYACDKLQGYLPDIDLGYDLIRVFPVLPGIDVMLLFNDTDDEFSAESKVLFPASAAYYLDMECLAMIGWLLADYLNLYAGGKEMTIM